MHAKHCTTTVFWVKQRAKLSCPLPKKSLDRALTLLCPKMTEPYQSVCGSGEKETLQVIALSSVLVLSDEGPKLHNKITTMLSVIPLLLNRKVELETFMQTKEQLLDSIHKLALPWNNLYCHCQLICTKRGRWLIHHYCVSKKESSQ